MSFACCRYAPESCWIILACFGELAPMGILQTGEKPENSCLFSVGLDHTEQFKREGLHSHPGLRCVMGAISLENLLMIQLALISDEFW